MQAIQGREKRDIRLHGGVTHQKLLLTDDLTEQVVTLGLAQVGDDWGLLAVFFLGISAAGPK